MLRWHCYPPGPPSRLTLYRLTTGYSALTLHGRALTSGTLHPVVLGQPIGTLWSNIRAKATTRPHPCRPDASVSPLQVPAAAPSVRGAHPGDAGRAFATATNFQTCEMPATQDLAACASPRRPAATVVDTRRAIRGEGSLSDTSPSPKIMKNYHQS